MKKKEKKKDLSIVQISFHNYLFVEEYVHIVPLLLESAFKKIEMLPNFTYVYKGVLFLPLYYDTFEKHLEVSCSHWYVEWHRVVILLRKYKKNLKKS